ncbi:glutamate--tRNA ligase [Acidobacteriota bacterium]
MVRVRFAPSPTGYLHVGAVRTCLFNWLFARHHHGKFLLRIEDTDAARSSDDMTQIILDGLKWLGLDWDEDLVFQSERMALYKERAEELVRKNKAYYCFCTPEEIRERKKDKEQSWMYDKYCRALSTQEISRLKSEGRERAVRFSVPEGETSFGDLIHGQISVKNHTIDDFVILRRDGLPTYHLSVVVDDLEQKITHVIRGDDHISNTPKQIFLYDAFEKSPPEFAHLALILGPDKKKLSKRHGVTSVLQFQELGYFPLSLLNFLALMSWDPGDGERIYSLREMTMKFNLENISKSSPVFDGAKLEWFNGQIISQMNPDRLFLYVKAELKKTGLWRDDLEAEKKDWFFKLLNLLKERSRSVDDFERRGRPFLADDFEYEASAVEQIPGAIFQKHHREISPG